MSCASGSLLLREFIRAKSFELKRIATWFSVSSQALYMAPPSVLCAAERLGKVSPKRVKTQQDSE
ncbi:hypothetical protein RchiOBHm_Chr2g0130131 [Rosa chinensis]|uniref:Uncharacterized protein n=1 Tax=Rosa chinensis TaxID=74649 RepID=A0A2P6RUR3_ROSCH|nr:hypothetical protein RchiOBHm_Chr2g0130131 [Rosa chinensis]